MSFAALQHTLVPHCCTPFAGAKVQTTVNDLSPSVLGTCAKFEEKQVGAERYNLFTGCPMAKTATLVLRGGSEQFIDEADRSLHDAIMIVRRALKHASVRQGAMVRQGLCVLSMIVKATLPHHVPHNTIFSSIYDRHVHK